MTETIPRLSVSKRRVLADEVTDDLREAIVTHEFKPGQKLSEDLLAVQLGVSRGPVREALMRLAGEGLVAIERHRGAKVSSWDQKDIEEIYSMRSVLETLAIEWACKNATAADLSEMDKTLKDYAKLSVKQRTPKEVSRIDLEFHSALFAASHHDRLIRSWEVLRSQIHAFLVYTWSHDEKINKTFLPMWGPEHEKLVEVIRQKKATSATEMIQHHVERGFQRVVKHFPDAH